jgi:hypothetical protein
MNEWMNEYVKEIRRNGLTIQTCGTSSIYNQVKYRFVLNSFISFTSIYLQNKR